MRMDQGIISSGGRFLRKEDAVLADVIQRVGPFRLPKRSSGYTVLVRSIVSQQISTSAARTICNRLEELLKTKRWTAEAVAQIGDQELQGIGISRQKRAYLADLTRKVLDGQVNFRRLSQASDEKAICELVAVKGIGQWTAEMFLMFGLQRADVFAPGDLGLQNAVTRLYGFSDRIVPTDLGEFAQRWSPYRTIAAWYLWRSLELEEQK